MVAFRAEDARDIGIKYSLPFHYTPGHPAMASSPGGKIVVAGGTRIVRILPNGKLDPRFGTDGSVDVERPAGFSFVLAGVAVDSQARILLAGSARPLPAETAPDPLLSSAIVMRFAADGAIDRSFGKEGTVISDLGIEPPAIGSTRYKGAAVGLTSVVVDSQDRPVLTGGSVSEVVPCYSSEIAISTGFVARLTDTGALDPSFGSGGVRHIASLSSFAQGNFFASGALLTVGSGKSPCAGRGTPPVVLTSFGSDGNLESSFGFAGFRSVPFPRGPVVTIGPSGKIVLLRVRRKGPQLVMRLLPNGAIDPSLGRTGSVRLIPPTGAAFKAVAVDKRGRLLFAGQASKRLSKRDAVRRSTFLLVRMKPKGTIDRSFGWRGSVRTGFGGPADSSASQVMLDRRGRIIVGGRVSTPRLGTGGGFALARYLPGR